VTAGTVFQGTRTPLTVWFEAGWLMTVPKNGVSALTLSQTLPVGSYQTAWTMLAKYRAAMSSADKEKLSGVVEVDEWVHGGVAKGGTSLTGKNLVMAAVERRPGGFGRARLGVVANRAAWELRKFVRAKVEPGSLVVTDGLSAYRGALAGYSHEALNESAPGAAEPHVLLPGVHRVFSLCERWLLGTHQGGVKRGHLAEYLDEFGFRWNRRNSRHRGIVFYRLLQHAVGGRPVTYKDLVRVGAPKPVAPAPPGSRVLPGTLEAAGGGRPWRRDGWGQPAAWPAAENM
jgi:transposase-like protein